MTDEELSISDATLIARLRLLNEVDANVAADRIKALLQAVRHANDHADVAIADMQSAEDRIEALVKERDEALEWLSASQGYIADAVFALDKQEKAEAKLAAMEVIATQWKARAERLEAALREIAKPYPADQDKLIHSQQQIASIARTALKGDNHE